MQIRVDIPLIGSLLVNGDIPKDQPVIAYIHEFFGKSTPPDKISQVINCSFVLPGYEEAVLAKECEGHILTWEKYGKAVAKTIETIDTSFILIGNSMGAMVAIYAAAHTSLIEQLTLYRIPRFGLARTHLRQKYKDISYSLADQKIYSQFLKTIRGKTSPNIMHVLEKTEWSTAKKLYEGASLSDLDPSVITQLTQSVTLLEHEFEGDYLHPKEAHDALHVLLLSSSALLINASDSKNVYK